MHPLGTVSVPNFMPIHQVDVETFEEVKTDLLMALDHKWTAIKFGTDIHGYKGVKLNYFCDPFTSTAIMCLSTWPSGDLECLYQISLQPIQSLAGHLMQNQKNVNLELQGKSGDSRVSRIHPKETTVICIKIYSSNICWDISIWTNQPANPPSNPRAKILVELKTWLLLMNSSTCKALNSQAPSDLTELTGPHYLTGTLHCQSAGLHVVPKA